MLRRFLIRLTLLSILASLLNVAWAQEIPLNYGDSVSGSISSSTPTVYSFNATADELIFIALATPEEDYNSLIRLYSPLGTELAVQEWQKVVGPLTVRTTGTYRIEISRTESEARDSDYTLTLGLAEITQIKADGVYTGNLDSPTDLDFFVYYGAPNQLFGYAIFGDSVNFTLRDPFGEIYLQTGFVSQDGNALNAVTLEGEYFGYVNTNNSEGASYTLNLVPIQVQTLEDGAAVDAELTEAMPAVFLLNAQADSVWRIDSYLIMGDATLTLRNVKTPDRVLVADYGSGADGSPRIDPFVAPENGQYYIVLEATNYQPDPNTYNYTLTLDATSLNFVTLDQEISGNVDVREGAIKYSYIGSAGETLVITLKRTSDVGAPSLALFSPEDVVVEFTARGQSEVTFSYVLPQAGLYQIAITNRDYIMASMGYTLMVSKK